MILYFTLLPLSIVVDNFHSKLLLYTIYMLLHAIQLYGDLNVVVSLM